MHPYKRNIQRDYNRPFFSNRRQGGYARLYFVVFMILLIVGLPIGAYWQYDAIQLAALDAIGFAPTPTPFAADHADLGEEFFVRGDVQTAAEYFELAVQQQPNNVNYLYEYGNLLIELDRSSEAAEMGERIMELAPDDPRGYALKANAIVWDDPVAAIPIAQEGVETEAAAGQFAPLHGALAVAFTLIGRFQEALEQGDLAVRIDPMDATVRRSFSYPLIFTGDYSGAINQLQTAININPNLTSPYFELAGLYRNQAINEPEMAVAIYNRVLEIEPENERAYARLCQTYGAVGLFQDAESYCDDALDINPNYALAHRERGRLRYTRRNYEGAIESFETCERLESGDIECLYLRGLAHYFLNECDLAWDYLNRSLQHPAAQGSILQQILQGLENVTINCAGYQGFSLPTPIPPTPIPPTPIGGL